MARTFEESEILYEQVKDFFWRKAEETDFIVAFSDGAMKFWEIIPIDSCDEMFSARVRLHSEGIDFAGFGHSEGRYCYYFMDQNFVKTQYLDNGEIHSFSVHSFCEFDLAAVARELRQLVHGS